MLGGLDHAARQHQREPLADANRAAVGLPPAADRIGLDLARREALAGSVPGAAGTAASQCRQTRPAATAESVFRHGRYIFRSRRSAVNSTSVVSICQRSRPTRTTSSPASRAERFDAILPRADAAGEPAQLTPRQDARVAALDVVRLDPAVGHRWELDTRIARRPSAETTSCTAFSSDSSLIRRSASGNRKSEITGTSDVLRTWLSIATMMSRALFAGVERAAASDTGRGSRGRASGRSADAPTPAAGTDRRR